MKFLSFLSFLLFSAALTAQISYENYPYSINNESIDLISSYTILKPNIDSLKAEDEITDNYKDIPWRFGSVVFDEIDFFKKADRNILPDGKLMYRLKLQSIDAVSININYRYFELNEGTQLFIHNGDYTETLGAFTHLNNPKRLDFATTLTQGKDAIIEVIMPVSDTGKSKVVISSVVYGYRSLRAKAANFGNSGSCNINANCPEGNSWQNEKRSIVMILKSNNSRHCSGALINNVRQDSTPYILSANHCGLDAGSSIYIFNYESATCSPSADGFTNQSVVGSTLRATNFKSDFSLFELFTTPPSSYNVFYSGWDATGNTPQMGTGIHHPRGDVKKISLDFDTLKSDQYNGATLPNGHWEVSDWDRGTTEPVSSGSPLYNEKHRIVGQLHGGRAACNNNLPDLYGKFSNSWNHDAPASQQLQKWLDPDSTNTTTIDGFDPNPSAFNRDLELFGFSKTYMIQCGNQNAPSILVSNRGNDLITSFQLAYQLNASPPVVVSFADTIKRNQVKELQLPPLLINNGLNNLTLFVNQINSSSDQNTLNDTIENLINGFIPSKNIVLTLKTDNYGSELSYQLLDSSGNTVFYSNSGYDDVTGGQVFNYNYCLTDGCYTLLLNDLANDGYCCTFGNGYSLIKLGNDTLLFDNTFNSSNIAIPFCIADSTTSLTEILIDNEINVFPNPAKGTINISYNRRNLPNTIQLMDARGQLLRQYNKTIKTIELQELQKGIYLLRIETPRGIAVKKIIKY